MTLSINDAQLPGLSAVDEYALKRITGCESVDLLRFRYRPGKRAVLHVKTKQSDRHQPKEGVVWLFAGDKAKRLARRLSMVTFDPSTGALYEQFPADHRLPELQQFLSLSSESMEGLIGGQLVDSPQLLRYRPGISCTFKCLRMDHKTVYVKIIAKEDLNAIVALNKRLGRILNDSDVSIAGALCVCTRLRLIAYQEAAGLPLEDLLAIKPESQVASIISRVAKAMDRLSSVPGIKTRELGRQELLQRATQAHRLITVADPSAGELAKALLHKMQETDFEPRRQLIHGDMKLDHVFLDTDCVTFIDTESLSIGDPDYDLAKLEIRLVAAYLTGSVSAETLISARRALANYTSTNYAWYHNAAVLQTAKFFAQRPSRKNIKYLRALLSGAQ